MADPLHRASRLLSYVLRHRPDAIGLEVDGAGWARIDELVRLTASGATPLTRALVEQVVLTNAKQRFAISDDGERIRANQGHSIDVDLGLQALTPPDVLFHGTATLRLDAILREGLRAQGRRHVHLSIAVDTALEVGRRHGAPAVLVVDAAAMHAAGHRFFVSANGVWLTDAVPATFLRRHVG